MWQSLFDELKDRGFVVLAIALDQAHAARPWIEAAAPGYPCLIDRDHHVADLYNLVNVPQAVWIDEDGRVVRDWVRRGAASAHALDATRAVARLPLPDASIAQAHALFRLGQHLLRQGREEQAQRHFAEAIRLHPDSWSLWRQTAPKDARGLAAGAAFWARVDALGDRPYYPPARLD